MPIGCSLTWLASEYRARRASVILHAPSVNGLCCIVRGTDFRGTRQFDRVKELTMLGLAAATLLFVLQNHDRDDRQGAGPRSVAHAAGPRRQGVRIAGILLQRECPLL
jgi:hypothetical protein